MITSGLVDYCERLVNGLLHRSDKFRPSDRAPLAERQPQVDRKIALELAGYTPDSARHFSTPKFKDMGSPVYRIIVHGSQATDKSVCDFSDVDIVVILDDSIQHAKSDVRRAVTGLLRLLKAVYAYDPLMHHGLMFYPRSGLEAYDQSFLPIETLKRAKTIVGDRNLEVVQAVADQSKLVARLRNSVNSLRRSFQHGDYLRNDFHLKRILSGVLLLPAGVLATRGCFVYKAESFGLAQELFNASQWELVRRAEDMRTKWIRPAQPPFASLLGSALHPRHGITWVKRFGSRANATRLVDLKHDAFAACARPCLDRLEHLVAQRSASNQLDKP